MDKECLDKYVLAINSTVGPEGLCSMLLVFGTIPRPAYNNSSATQKMCEETVQNTQKEITKIHAKVRLSFDLRHMNGPKECQK